MVWMIYVHTFIQCRTFKSFEELIADYESGELHPADLKPALSKSLNKILEVMFSGYVYASLHTSPSLVLIVISTICTRLSVFSLSIETML